MMSFARSAAVICGLGSAAIAQAMTLDRGSEGDWAVADHTNNNTGERDVYAFQMYFPRDQSGYVTLTMRCSAGKPKFFVEWTELNFPDQTVISISPMLDEASAPVEGRYVFEKSEEPVESGLRATPEVSQQIVAAMGQATFAKVTAHLSSGPQTITMPIAGVQGAWSRVSRHCPIRTMPVPPM